MSTFDDSSFEMHDDSFNPDTADQLLNGEITSPEFADLAAMVADVRSMTSATPTPEVRGALAEYVGVGLTATKAPAEPSASAVVSESIDLTTATQPRRKSVIAEVVTFAGTLSGKLLLGGAVAAASVTGAQASGVVDLPGLPDKPSTVVVADEVPAELPLEDIVEKPEAIEPADKPAELVEEPAEDKVEEDKTEEVEDKNEDETEDKVEEEKTEDKVEEKAEEPKVEEKVEEKGEEHKADDKVEEKAEDKTEEKPANEEAIIALQTQLTADKEVVYAAASAQIQPLEAEKKPLVEALNTTLAQLETARNDAKAPLYAELETTEDEQRKAEIEAELSAIYEQWELDRDAAKAAANPAIEAIEGQIEDIEIARDAEIDRLFEEYHAAVEALNS